MTKTVLPLQTLLLLSGNLFAGNAIAQQAAVDHCKQTANDADRIVCLEAALLEKESEEIGESQVVARNQTTEEMRESLEKASGLAVASYAVVPYEKMLVTLENGQVWQQIKGDTQKIRIDLKRNQTVDIEESSLSGYKMHLNEMGRTIRVQRVQ